jgi:hypothetical protein
MPRNGRGGSRTGTPGTAYENRTDLATNRQPVAAPQGQTYGERGRQEAAQAAVPIPDIAAMTASLPGLTDPSQRPDEPLTAGLPMGEGVGPNPMAAQMGSVGAGLLRRMIASGNTDPELFELLASAERGQRPAAMMPPAFDGTGGRAGAAAGKVFQRTAQTNPTGVNSGAMVGHGQTS